MNKEENKNDYNEVINDTFDVVLVGAGMMSATLGVMLKQVMPDAKIAIFERMEDVAMESSDAWNNAGTGHSAFCELNYTPQNDAGDIDISKALTIAASFEISKEFWAYLLERKYIKNPRSFLNKTPHISFVWGEENVAFLKKRYQMLTENALFEGMEYSEDIKTLTEWMPLVMEKRNPLEKVAATKMDIGTDINFGALAREMFAYLDRQEDTSLFLSHEIRDLEKIDKKDENGEKQSYWKLRIKDLKNDSKEFVYGKFVFVGAGGGAFPLLDKSDIPEGAGFGGFPISGQWLKCNNEAVIAKHASKVYGKASVGAPPMSVPHLDTRMINGKKELLFGPYAGFSTKFLKNGSYFDLPFSVDFGNMFPMLSAGFRNLPLTKYLVEQVTQSMEDRMQALREYFPDAKTEDWELVVAGQRVQIIKKDDKEGGKLEFGTEIVSSADSSFAALLGASPGASTAVTIMLDLMKKCFKEELNTPAWQTTLKYMLPSYGNSLITDAELCRKVREKTNKVLFGEGKV